MKTPRMGLVVAAFAALTISQARAQERAIERLELTMTLLPEEAQDSGALTRLIELPPPAAAGDRPEEPPGVDRGEGNGPETAAEARERGREFGQSVAEQARDNRENASRGESPADPSENPPGPPADLPPPGGGPPDDVGGGRPAP